MAYLLLGFFKGVCFSFLMYISTIFFFKELGLKVGDPKEPHFLFLQGIFFSNVHTRKKPSVS